MPVTTLIGEDETTVTGGPGGPERAWVIEVDDANGNFGVFCSWVREEHATCPKLYAILGAAKADARRFNAMFAARAEVREATPEERSRGQWVA